LKETSTNIQLLLQYYLTKKLFILNYAIQVCWWWDAI